MKVIHAPKTYNLNQGKTPIVFLAGSIEMGKAGDWQKEVIELCEDKNVLLLNPRRPDWDNSWEQTIENKEFKEQVEWELDGLDACDILFIYFDPETKAPITLLELGLHANTDKRMIVCCPEGYHRKGNVEIVCERYGILFTDDFAKAVSVLRVSLEALNKNV